MSGETVEVWGAARALETSGLTVANGAIVQVSSWYDKNGADGNGYPDAQFILDVTFGVAPVENSLISIYAREYGMDGGIRTQAPEASRIERSIGSFRVNDVAGSLQRLIFMAYDLPGKADYYLHNNGTGQAMNSGWKLTVVPRTYGPRP